MSVEIHQCKSCGMIREEKGICHKCASNDIVTVKYKCLAEKYLDPQEHFVRYVDIPDDEEYSTDGEMFPKKDGEKAPESNLDELDDDLIPTFIGH